MHRNFDSNMREAEFWVLGPVFAWGFPFGRRGMVVAVFTMATDGNDGKWERKRSEAKDQEEATLRVSIVGGNHGDWGWDLPIGSNRHWLTTGCSFLKHPASAALLFVGVTPPHGG